MESESDFCKQSHDNQPVKNCLIQNDAIRFHIMYLERIILNNLSKDKIQMWPKVNGL